MTFVAGKVTGMTIMTLTEHGGDQLLDQVLL